MLKELSGCQFVLSPISTIETRSYSVQAPTSETNQSKYSNPKQIRSETGLSCTQQKILKIITESVEKTGWSPAVSYIGQSVGLKSNGSTAYHLAALESKGFLCRDPNNKHLWIPANLDPSSDKKISCSRRYRRLNNINRAPYTSNDEERINELISQLDPNKSATIDFILQEYPISQLKKRLKLTKIIYKTPTDQTLLALMFRPSSEPIENISKTISSLNKLNLTPQITTTILDTIPQQYPQFLNIYQLYLDNLSIKQTVY